MLSILTGARRWALASLLLVAISLSACGGGDSGDDSGGEEATTAKEAVAAFEAAAGGYEFEKAISLVDGAVAYSPKSSADPDVVEPLNEALGDSSVLWQVLVFDGPEPPLDEAAAKQAAFASDGFKEAAEGVYLGDNDIVYIPNGNVIATGPVIDGNVDDETLKRWQAVVEEL